jgi:hypothetical protein
MKKGFLEGDSAELSSTSERMLDLLRIALEYKYDLAYAKKLRRQGSEAPSPEVSLTKALEEHAQKFPQSAASKQGVRALLRLRSETLEEKLNEFNAVETLVVK